MTAHAKAKKSRGLPPQEELLIDYAGRLDRHRKGRRAVHVKIALLTKYYRQQHYVATAAAAFKPLVKKFDGQLFELTSGDLVFAVKGASVAEIDDVILKIRYLFADDQKLKAIEADESGIDFCDWYDVEKDYDGFLAMALRLGSESGGEKAEGDDGPAGPAAAMQPEPEPVAPKPVAPEPRLSPKPNVQFKTITPPKKEAPTRRPVSVADASALVRAIQTVDLEPVIRRSQICLLHADAAPEPVYREVHVPLSLVAERVLPDCDVHADPWLQRHLTAILDQRALAMWPEMIDKSPLATAIRVTPRQVFSSAFDAFDEARNRQGWGPIILRLPLLEILADLPGFHRASEKARGLGYRLCIEGFDAFTFQALDRGLFKVDFERIQAQPEHVDHLVDAAHTRFVDAVAASGKPKVILAGCADKSVVDFGLGAGIAIFQGAYVDSLIDG